MVEQRRILKLLLSIWSAFVIRCACLCEWIISLHRINNIEKEQNSRSKMFMAETRCNRSVDRKLFCADTACVSVWFECIVSEWDGWIQIHSFGENIFVCVVRAHNFNAIGSTTYNFPFIFFYFVLSFIFLPRYFILLWLLMVLLLLLVLLLMPFIFINGPIHISSVCPFEFMHSFLLRLAEIQQTNERELLRSITM